MTDVLETRYVFVDTSMYERKNFQFHQHALGHFKELCGESTLYLLINSVVEGEVRSHLIEKAREAAKNVKEFKKTIKVLRNLPELKHHGIFDELQETTVEQLLIEKFQEFIDEAVYEFVDLNTASISEIVGKYFNKKPPFSDKKKDEFPDAIILESLLTWAKNKNTQVYILSTDGDMRNYCEACGSWLNYVDDLEKFLNVVVTTEESLADLAKFAEVQFDSQVKKIEARLEEQINTIEYSTSGYGVDDQVDDVNAYGLSMLERNIIKSDREYAEFSVSINFTVEAWHRLTDYDRSIWDPEDKKYIFTAQSSRKVRHEVNCNAYVWIDFEDGLAINTYLNEVNIEDSYIELDPDDGIELDYQEHDLFDE